MIQLKDGIITMEEGLAAAAVIVALLIVFFVVRMIAERRHIRKTSIFRVKKNRYKSRLGKKIKY